MSWRRRGARIALIGFAVLAVLLAAAFFFVRQAYPPERLAAMLAAQVSAATGRSFRIDGGLSLRLLPSIAIEARDIALGNPAWAEGPDMLRAHRVAFDIEWRALLHGALHIQRVDLQDADLKLLSDGAGRTNWQFEGQNEGRGEGQGHAGGAAPSVALDEIDATGLRLSFENLAKGSTQTLDFETLSLATKDDKTRLRAAGLLGQSHWTIEGETGALVALGRSDGWPFDLRFASDKASGSAKGSLGSGVHGGELNAQVALRLESDAALLGLGIALPSLPMPVDASATI
ncbi:MAG TPA: AsmA family protein, partial [Variovorax sp.]